MNLALQFFLHALLLAFVVLCLPTGHAIAQAPADPVPTVQIMGPPPVRYFFSNPVFSSAVLSPNAKFLAVRFGSEKERDRLAVVDLVNNTVKVVAAATDGDIDSFQWVNDKRLVFSTADKRITPGVALQLRPGLSGVDRDGGHVQPLIATDFVTVPRVLSWDYYLAFPAGKQDTDEVYAYRANKFANEKRNHLGFVRLNTGPGKACRSIVRVPASSGLPTATAYRA
ncbi:MAG: hypothetical protein V4631_18660 [Pseudomonadota bacterium]